MHVRVNAFCINVEGSVHDCTLGQHGPETGSGVYAGLCLLRTLGKQRVWGWWLQQGEAVPAGVWGCSDVLGTQLLSQPVPLSCHLPWLSQVHCAASPAGHHVTAGPWTSCACRCSRLQFGSLCCRMDRNPMSCPVVSLQHGVILYPCTECPCYMWFNEHTAVLMLLALLGQWAHFSCFSTG